MGVDAPERPAIEARPRDRRAIARFFGNHRVRKIIVGTALGASALIPIPMLAHHPGAQPPVRPDPVSGPVVEVPPTLDPGAPITIAPEPPPPAPRPALDAAFSGWNITSRSVTEPFPGIRYLHATAPNEAFHIAEIDLSNPAYQIRVTGSDERNQTTTSFAQNTNALVAINGDFFEYGSYAPHGLAISEGQTWPNSADLAEWLFLACDRAKHCEIDGENHLAPIDPTWTSAIGGNGVALVVDGQPRYNEDPFYSTDRHPRSAVGLTKDGRMILIAAEGRQGDAIGLTFNEMARLMSELGVEQAMMFDGGGSTSLVLGGQRVNELPSGSGERPVSNHIAIVPA